MCSLFERRSKRPSSTDHDLAAVEQVLLDGQLRYRKADVAAAAGVSLDRAERLWQALGFAHVDDDAVVFTSNDVAALGMLDRLVSAGVVTPELETAVARSLAQTMSRLAEWQVGIFKSVLGDDFADLDTVAHFAKAMLPAMQQLQEHVWRRHLAATAARELTEVEAADQERTLVVGFADIVGYTRLIRDFSELELAKLIDDFEDLSTGVIAENYGRIVKTVGDEVLFVTDTAEHATEIALRLHEGIADRPQLPPLRIGMAQGVVLARFGDVYGSTVNIASRLTSLAKPASVLVDREVAAELRDNPDYSLASIGPTKVQGFRGLRAWSLRRRTASQ